VYGDKVRIVWKNMPLDIHKDAPLAHLAAMAAGEQGKFWEYHDKLFKNQPKIQRDFLLQYARELGLDMKRFQQSLDMAQAKPQIDADAAEAKSLGVTGTPAFFVNGRYLSGAKPFEEFAQSINTELTRLKLPVPAMPSPAKPSAEPGG
jgi:protein-disulfide isomerase